MKKDNAVRTTIYLDKDLAKAFKIYCTSQGISMSKAIEEYIKKQLG